VKSSLRSGLVALLMMGLPGCVSLSTHEETLQELQVITSDLDRTRARNEALTKQVQMLRESNTRLQDGIASLNAAAVKTENAENKVKELDRQVKELTVVKKALTQELEVQRQVSETHLKTIRRQQKELRERERAALLQPPTPKPDSEAAAHAPAPQTPETSPPASSVIDINKASAADLALILGLSKEDAERLIKNRPYKSTEELVSKQGMDRATVDRIKDKITVGP